MFNGSTILVTGGTGSFGQHFVATLLESCQPRKVIIYSRDELKQLEMQQNPVFAKHSNKLRYLIGDIRDQQRLEFAVSGVDYLVHAAALKQVPALEYNPFEAVKTNVVGSQNVIDAAMRSNVKKVIGVSTDKASTPVNLYGATKLTSEKLFVAANNYAGRCDSKFSVVRYGNVMGSRGSVIPLFLKMRDAGVLPVTDKAMTRFNITLARGVDFVLRCFFEMCGGEVFVPKISSYRITDLAAAINPNAKLDVIGTRPGEKLHEELISQFEAVKTLEYKDHYVITPYSDLAGWDIEEFIANNGGASSDYCDAMFSYKSNMNGEYLTVDELRCLIIENVPGGEILKSAV